jgi:hypothetical protein
MTDYSRDLAGAEYYARMHALPAWPDRPSRAEIAADEHGPIQGAVEIGSPEYWRMVGPIKPMEPHDWRDPAGDEPERSALQRSNDGTDDDPTWDVLRSVASGAELQARDIYGDQAIDRAIRRVLDEEEL